MSARRCSLRSPAMQRSFRRTRASRGHSTRVYAGTAVQFRLPFQASFGEDLALVGSHALLGSWDPKNAAVMTWAEGDTWTFDAIFLENTALEYKYIRRSAGAVVWEEGDNRKLDVDVATASSITISELWGHPESSEISVAGAEAAPSEEAAAPAAAAATAEAAPAAAAPADAPEPAAEAAAPAEPAAAEAPVPPAAAEASPASNKELEAVGAAAAGGAAAGGVGELATTAPASNGHVVEAASSNGHAAEAAPAGAAATGDAGLEEFLKIEELGGNGDGGNGAVEAERELVVAGVASGAAEVGGAPVQAAPEAAPAPAAEEAPAPVVTDEAPAPAAVVDEAPAPAPVAEEVVASAEEPAPAAELAAEEAHKAQPCEYLGMALLDVRAMMESSPGITLLPYDE